jgi:hypothetical protein
MFVIKVALRRHVSLRLTKMVRRAKTLRKTVVLIALMSSMFTVNASAESTSVYVAGKGKYCKENLVSGYLDCFYASPDACQKYSKSADLKCVANPNSGT